MAKLTSEQRKRMPKSKFAVPSTKDFPLNDKEHDRKALQLAPKSYKAGNISKSKEEMIESKARKALYGKSGKPKSKKK